MKPLYTLKRQTGLFASFLLTVLLTVVSVLTSYGQSKEYADVIPSSGRNGATIIAGILGSYSPTNNNAVAQVLNPANAGDGSDATNATLEASNLNLALVQWSGEAWVQLKFPANRAANSTTYVRIDEPILTGLDADLLEIVGGLLGLLENEVIIPEVYSGAATASNGTQVPAANVASTIVRGMDGNLYLAVTPSQEYNSVRIKLRNQGNLLGLALGSTLHLNVYNAFTLDNTATCGTAIFTDLGETSGITASLADVVQNPGNAIDGDPSTHSTITAGNLSLLGSIFQTVYFNELSAPQDYFKIRLRIGGGGLLDLELLGNFEVRAYNGDELVYTKKLAGGVINGVDLLTLLQSGNPVTVPFGPGVPFDRVSIGINTAASVSLAANPLKVYSVERYGTGDSPLTCTDPDPIPLPEPTDPMLSQSDCDATVIAFEHADFPYNTVDGNNDTYTTLEASSGLAAGVGAYEGFIELGFNPREAGTTTFIRIDFDDEVLYGLLDGSVGQLLGGVVDNALFGSHYFTVEAKNNGNTVLTASSNNGFFEQPVRIVQDKNGHFYVAVTPGAGYNSIRITEELGALLGLGEFRTMNVYHACMSTGSDTCEPAFATYSESSGISLDLLGVGGAGVNDAHLAIDLGTGAVEDDDTYSEISIGAAGIGASIFQSVEFHTLSSPADYFKVKLAWNNGSALNAELLSNIEIRAYDGDELVYSQQLQNGLVAGLDILGLLSTDNAVTIPFGPGVPFDRVAVGLNALADLSALSSPLRLYGVERYGDVCTDPNPLPEPPVTPSPFNSSICGTTLGDFGHVNFAYNAVDGNHDTYATLTAGSGEILGSGAYDGFIELGYDQPVNAREISYVRIDMEDEELLNALVGGSLGEFLADLGGGLVFGNHYFEVSVRNPSGGEIYNTSSISGFGDENFRIVRDELGRYYIAFTADVPYQSVRITLKNVAVAGLGATTTMNVYGMCREGQFDNCEQATFTSFDGTGLSGDILGAGGAGVTNPQYVIDENNSNYSELNLGTAALGATIYQDVYYKAKAAATDTVKLSLQMPQTLANAEILGAYRVYLFNGDDQVYEATLSQGLINDVDLLGLFNTGAVVGVEFAPGVEYDRVRLELGSLASVGVGSPVRWYGVYRISADCPNPEFEEPPYLSPVCIEEILSAENVDDIQNVIDGNHNSYATIRSDAGLVVGIGAYSGHLEMGYPAAADANTTSYIRISEENGVLDALLGGSLGEFLGGLGELAALGDHYFDVIVKNAGGTTVLERSSQNGFRDGSGDFDPKVRIVQDITGRYYLAVTPDVPYQSVRLETHTTALLGATSSEGRLNVYGMCYETGVDGCAVPVTTSYNGTGLNADLLGTGGAGVENAYWAIDENTSNYSTLSLGNISVAGSIQQNIQFNRAIEEDTPIRIRLAVGAGTLSADLLSTLEIIGYSDNQEVYREEFEQAFVGVNLIDLLNNGEAADLMVTPGVPVDEIAVSLSSLAGIGVAPNVQLYAVLPDCDAPEFISWKSYVVDGDPSLTSVSGGEEVVYTVHVRNTGETDLEDFIVTDSVPAHTQYVENSGGTLDSGVVTFTGISVPAGGETTVSFTVTVDEDLTGVSEIFNVALVKADENDPGEESYPPLDNENPTDPDDSGDTGTVITVDAGLLPPVVDPESATIHLGDTVTFTASSENPDPVEYVWYDPDGNEVFVGDQFTTPDSLPLGEHIYTVTARNPDTGEESTATEVPVTVVEAGELLPPVVDPESATIPLGDTVTFTASSENPDPVEYVWYDPDGNEVFVGDQFTTPDSLPLGEHIYTVTARNPDTGEESTATEVPVTVVEDGGLLPPTVDPPSATVPVGETDVTFTASHDNPDVEFIWFDEDGNEVGTGPVFTTPSTLPVGDHVYTVIVRDPNTGEESGPATALVRVYDPEACPPGYQAIFADSQESNSPGNVANAGQAVDGNLQTHSSIAIPALPTTRYQHLGLPTSYNYSAGDELHVKIGTDVDLSLLSIQVTLQAYNGDDPQGAPVTLSSGLLLSLLSGENQADIVIPDPGDSFDAVRVSVRGALLSTGDIHVFGAYINRPVETLAACEPVSDILTGSTSGALGTLNGVTDPENVADGDPETIALIRQNLGVAGYVHLTTVYPSLSAPGDSIRLIMQNPDGGLLDANVFSRVSIVAYHGNTEVHTAPVDGNLLRIGLLPGSENINVISYAVDQPFDRVSVQAGGLANALTSVNVNEIERVPAISVEGIDGGVVTACQGDSVNLETLPDGCTQYAWYDAMYGGTLLGEGANLVLDPGTFEPGMDTVYVQPIRNGCDNLGRSPVIIQINDTPTANDIELTANADAYCEGEPVMLAAAVTAGSGIENPVFTWYTDPDKENPVASSDSITYEVNGGELTITGLPVGTHMYYVSVQDGPDGCENMAGDLAEIQVEVKSGATAEDIQAEDVTVCFGEPVVLEASSSTITDPVFNWYTNAELDGDPVHTGATFEVDSLEAGIYTYYVTVQNEEICENSAGDALAVTVTVQHQITAADIDLADSLSQCVGSPVAIMAGVAGDLQVGNPVFTWYFDAEGTAMIESGEMDGVTYTVNNGELIIEGLPDGETSTYYVSLSGDSVCANEGGDLAMVEVTISNELDAPVFEEADLAVCEGEDAVFVISNFQEGLTYSFYTTQDGDTPAYTTAENMLTIPAAEVGDGDVYYVEVMGEGDCASLTRTMVTITINDPATAADITVDSAIVACEGDGVVIAPSLSATSEITGDPVFRWYTGADKTGELTDEVAADGTLTLEGLAAGTYTYYVSVTTEDACENEAGDLAMVEITVGEPAEAPQVSPVEQFVVVGEEAAPFVSEEPAAGEVVWYSNAELTNEVFRGTSFVPPTGAVGTFTYYAVIEEGACISAATEVVLNVTDLPTPPEECYVAGDQESGTQFPCLLCSVQNPTNSVDADPDNFTRLVMGVGALQGSVYQTLIFQHPGKAGDTIMLDLRVPIGLADASLLGAVRLTVYNGDTQVSQFTLDDATLIIRLLGSPDRGQVLIPAGGAFDRIEIRNMAGIATALESVDIYGASILQAAPELDTDELTVCQGEEAFITATPAAGTTLRWYDAEQGGNLLHTGNTFEVPTGEPGTTVYYIEIVDTESGCPSPERIPVTVTVEPAATAADIQVPAIEPVCFGEPVMLEASSTTVTDPVFNWYDNAELEGEPAYTGAAITIEGLEAGEHTFYVTVQNEDICENVAGDALAVTVTVQHQITAADIDLPETLSQCVGSPVAIMAEVAGDLQVENPVFTWYFDAEGTEMIESGEMNGVTYTVNDGELIIEGLPEGATATYYVSLGGDNVCANAGGDLAMVDVTIGNELDAPVFTAADLVLCAGEDAVFVIDNFQDGLVYRFYTTEDGDTPAYTTAENMLTIPAAEVNDGDVYYVDVMGEGDCASLTRTMVTITINDPATAADIEVQGETEICEGTELVLTPSLSAGSEITGDPVFRWYENGDKTGELTDGVAADGTLTLADLAAGTYTYYVSVTAEDACENEAGDLAEVTVTVGEPQEAPEVSPVEQFVVVGEPAAPFMTEVPAAGEVVWYSDAELTEEVFRGESFTPPTAEVGTFTYYAVIEEGACVSEATEVTLNVVGQPTPPEECFIANDQESGTQFPCLLCSVQNPTNSVDDNPDNFTRLVMGVGAVQGSVYQTLIFDHPGKAGDQIMLDLRIPGGLADASLLGAIRLTVYNGDTQVSQFTLDDAALVIRLLGGPDRGQVLVPAGGAYDRIEIRNMAGVATLLESVDIYGATILQAEPELNIPDPLVLCQGEEYVINAVPAAGTILRWYDAEQGGNLLYEGSDFTVPTEEAGNFTYYIEIVDQASMCPSPERVAVDVEVTDAPGAGDIAVSGNEDPFCEGDVVVLTPSSTTITNPVFSWYKDAAKTEPIMDGDTDGAVSYSVDANGVLTVNGLAAGTSFWVSVTTDGGNGCENPAGELLEVPVMVGPNAPADAITDAGVEGDLGGGEVCLDPDGNITLTAGSTLEGAVFHWYDENGDPVTGGEDGTLVLEGLMPGTYTFYIGVSNQEFCETAESDRAEVTFTILPNVPGTDIAEIEVEGISDNGEVCLDVDGEVTLTASLTGQSTVTDPVFHWYDENGDPVAGGENGTLMLALDPGTYTFWVGASATGYCETLEAERKSVTFTVNPAAGPDDIADVTVNGADPGDPLCIEPGEEVVLTAMLSANSTITGEMFHWYDAAGDPVAGGANGTLNLGVLAPGDYTYTVGVSGDGVCESLESDRKSVSFSINEPFPMDDIAEITVSGTLPGGNVCLDAEGRAVLTARLTNNSTITNVVFTWYDANGNPVTDGVQQGNAESTLTLSGLMAGTTYTYSVGARGDGFCESAAADRRQITFTIGRQTDDSDITASGDEICEGETAMLTAGSTTVTNPVFTWYSDADLTDQIGTEADLEVTPAETTNYYVTVRGDDACEGEAAMVTVTVNERATAADIIADNYTICAGETVTLTAGSSITNAMFTWYSDATLAEVLGTGATLEVTPAETTSYFVTVEGTGFCANVPGEAKEVSVNVGRPGMAADIEVAGAGNVCEGDDIVLTASSGTVNNPVFRWYEDAALTTLLYEGAEFTVADPAAGDYTFYVTVEGEGVCENAPDDAATAEVTVGDEPDAPVVEVDLYRECPETPLTLTATVPSGLTVRWYTQAAGGDVVGEGNTLEVTVQGNVTYYAEAVGGSGTCVSVDRTPVIVEEIPQLPAPEVSCAERLPSEVRFEWQPVTGAEGYEVNVNEAGWKEPSSGSEGTVHVETNIDHTIVYSIQVRALSPDGDCGNSAPGTSDCEIEDFDDLYIPNAFTPNSDGRNDWLYVRGTYENLDIKIYNQWGNLVFETTDPGTGWDGTYKGQHQPMGVYFYRATVTMPGGREVNRKGSISLIR